MKSLEQAITDECKRQGKSRSEITELELDSRCRAQTIEAASGLDCIKVLSLCNTGVNSLAAFPSLPSLHTLRLSDNKLSGGLEHLVSAGLTNLRSLDLAGNTGIAKLEQLAPLKDLPVKCLDLDGCPVKDLPDFSNKLFAMLQELEYLDNVDKNGVEREADEEEEEEDDEGFEGEEGGDDADGEDDEGEDAEGTAEEKKPRPDYAALLNAEPLADDEEEYEDEDEDEDEAFDEDEEGEGDDEEEGGSGKKRKRTGDDDDGRDNAEEEDDEEADD